MYDVIIIIYKMLQFYCFNKNIHISSYCISHQQFMAISCQYFYPIYVTEIDELACANAGALIDRSDTV